MLDKVSTTFYGTDSNFHGMPEKIYLSKTDQIYLYRHAVAFEGEYQAREDGLHIVHKLNRHYIAHHYEGTRITTYFKQGQGEQVDTIRVEKPPFVAVTTNPELGTFNVQLSQNFSLLVNPNGTCVIHEKNGTQFAYHTDGSLLFTPDCRHCENSAKGLPFTTFVVYPYKETMFESYDHMGRHFSVKSNGVITVAGAAAEASSEENDPLNRRYFIAYPDGSGSELVDEKRMEEILNTSVENPLCQIDSNTLPNNTSVDGIQIFSPIAKTYLDTWRTNYEMDSIVPSGLTSKDLQPILPFGDRGGRHTFGRGVGNGLHVKPVGNPNPATARCFDPPQVWQLRNFLKFRKMTPELREVFQTRITELNKEIRQLEEQKQRAHAVDFRANTEQQLSASLLSLAKATGLPRNKSGKGIKSNPAGAEKTSTKTKAQFKNKMSKVGCLYGLCSEIRLNHNRLLIYRTTDCLPPFFKCQLGREALLRIKEKPATNIRTKHLVVEEKTPPLLKGAPLRKPNTPQSTKKRDIYKRDGAKVPPLAMPGWANMNAFLPANGRIKRAQFVMKPWQVDFGTMKEGATMRHRVYLKNNGIENSAVRVRQPPKETGLSVSCTPLLVMAGMQATLDVEIHALLPSSVNKQGEGRVYHELEIRTDIETLYLPITATVVVGGLSATSNIL